MRSLFEITIRSVPSGVDDVDAMDGDFVERLRRRLAERRRRQHDHDEGVEDRKRRSSRI
jgi:hypothetical protein